jgi:hypothetical protein
VAGTALSATLAACGGGQRLDANEPKGNFTVSVSSAKFPVSQNLSQHTHLVITVHNAGTKAIPDVAVTICNVTCAYPARPNQGTAAEAFAEDLNMAHLADPSRPVWVVDHPPGPCLYSCKSGGPGGAVTAYANTWALGRLAAGASATFDWGVTAVSAGRHVVAWEVAAGLNGKAKAVLQDGSIPHGSFTVMVHKAPQQTCVTNNLKITTRCQAGA